MEDDVGVRKLVELIFVKKFIITTEMTATDPSFPTCLLTNNFSEKLLHIFLARHMITGLKWRKVLETYTCDMLSTKKLYLDHIILGCFNEHYSNLKIFDSFISVCSFVKCVSEEIFLTKGLNFSDLNTFIIMEFYESVLKKTFLRCGGFQRLVEYMHHHKYLAWKWCQNDLASVADLSTPVDADIVKKLNKELSEECNIKKSFADKLSVIRTSADSMAQRIISAASVQLHPLQCDHDSNQTVGASGLSDEAETAQEKIRVDDIKLEPLVEVFQECSNSDSKTNQVAKQNEGITWYDSIIQAVIKYNRSKTAGLGTSDDRLKKAEGILKHLNDTIESLIDVLDEYDKE